MPPYIAQAARDDILLGRYLAETSGELNFVLTTCILQYLERISGGKPTYDHYNEVFGVLYCVAAELYARRLRPLEDQKCLVNGDLY